MMNIRFYLYIALLLNFSSLCYVRAQETEKGRTAKQHFERAEQLAAFRDPKAEQEYKLAIQSCDGHYPQAWFELSRILQRQLRLTEAVTALQNYISQTPQDDHIADAKDLADLKRAIELQNRIDKVNGLSLEEYLEFIPLVAGFGDAKDALPYAEKALTLYPSSSEANLMLARFLPIEQKARRLTLVKTAIELSPNNPAAHSQLGWYYYSPEGDIKKSIQEFRKALELTDGQYADAWQGLGQALTADGQKTEAIEAYRNYLKTRRVPSQYDNYVAREIDRLKGEPLTKKWVLEQPTSPVRITLSANGEDYNVDNHSVHRVSGYQLGCAVEEAGKIRIKRRARPKQVDLLPLNKNQSRKYGKSYTVYADSDFYPCVERKTKIAVLEVRFSDGSKWRINNVTEDKQRPVSYIRYKP
jgi:tetratricopeptide (TPR) repeat protein